MIYNFNLCPRSGKTYYEINRQWKYLKQRIKIILDSPQSSKYEKILEIEVLLQDYKARFLKDRS